MASEQSPRPTFEITHETAPSDKLVAGFSTYGLAGLTAVDYLTTQLDLEVTGYVTTEALPAITPFENGVPRHHTRLYSREGLDLTVLQNELFVPPWAADAFSDAILGWTDANDVEEVTVLSGAPIPHQETDHRSFHVATADYRESRLKGQDVPGLGTGFLEGVNASLVGRGMDTSLRVGIILTPVHAQVPDVQAAVRLVETVGHLFDLSVDTTELEAFARKVEEYYEGLAQRLEAQAEDSGTLDRMYM